MEITKEQIAKIVGVSLLIGKAYSLTDDDIDQLSDEIIALGASVETGEELMSGIKALFEAAKDASYAERQRADDYLASIS